VFYADEEQRTVTERYIEQLGRIGAFSQPIVTEVEPLEAFYEAEDYHHDYAARNPMQPYIRAVSTPKVEKLRKVHGPLLKRGAAAE
jgi:peptide-methionine (S)-S-oxide reductase